MLNYLYILLLISLFFNTELNAQNQHFIVERAPFSTGMSDEFSPVFYKGGIVFCSNLRDNSLIGYKDEQNRLFKIFYVEGKSKKGWKSPHLLSKELTTDLNDGPVTFNKDGNIIYYSRNNTIENSLKNITDTSNKLGIYRAELINGIWANIKPFEFNQALYSFCTPALAPDGKRIYFSSDMPGGYGGMDLYYCDSLNEGWDMPVNLGPVINTPENESFPFASDFNKLFFASDGHKGLGGKDLYYTQEINGTWISPVPLDSTINSAADDFGIVFDSTFEKGYFSSNRLNTDDIFRFSSAPVEFSSCDTIRENNYCYTLYDERHRLTDSISASYFWDFGDGTIRKGAEVQHCFPGPGKYMVKLTIIDDRTGDTITKQVNHNVKLEDIEQASINSYNIGLVDKPLSFGGAKINLKDFRITDYLWNFGEGFKPGGILMSRTFKKKGEYMIRLGLLGEKDSLGIIPQKCFMKKIRIYDSYQELELTGRRGNELFIERIDSLGLHDKKLQSMIYFMDDLSERQKSKIKEMIKSPIDQTVNFNKNGIIPDSYLLLDNISKILTEDRNIRLEIVTHSFNDEIPAVKKMELSERWAQELNLYFRNKVISSNSYHTMGYGLSGSVFKPVVPESKKTDGVIEFIFMKN